jgi:ABC-2 type transport system permease protein
MGAHELAHELTAVWALTWRDLKRFSRDRAQILGAIARPALWLLLMGKGLGASVPRLQGVDYEHFIFPGAIALSVLFGGMFQSITIIWDREFGFLKEVFVAPISRVSIVLGKTFSAAAVTLIQALIATALAPLIGLRLALPMIVGITLVAALLSIAISALGVVMAARMQTFEGFGVISNFVVLPLYFLSGGVFPIQNVPGWMAIPIHLNPVTYGVDLMRRIMGQPAAFTTSVDALVVAGFAVVMVLLALAVFRRQ